MSFGFVLSLEFWGVGRVNDGMGGGERMWW